MSKLIRSYLVLPLIAFYLYISGSASFLGQWDSYDYLKQIVSHQLSALGFGRPAFLGYNILLWESARYFFRLEPLKVEMVVMLATVLLGVAGVLLFRKLAQQLLSPAAVRMAVLALTISPMYAIYSGFVMTEVPMIVALIAAAFLLWRQTPRHRVLSDIVSGLLFGVAVGIREQALTLGAAYLWILWSRPGKEKSRISALISFGSAGTAAVLAPVVLFYFADPAGFIEHMRIWLHAIPMGNIQFWNNVQASLLWLLAICPASWLCLAAAPFLRSSKTSSTPSIPNPVTGFACAVVLPVILLWRDADVQIHPRYLLIALPGTLIFCAHIYSRWAGSRKGMLLWAVAHVLFFGLTMTALHPYFQDQDNKMQNVRTLAEAIPGDALLIAGSYSPMLDYYRGIGVRPKWKILWSGWDWNPRAAEETIRRAWANRVPVFLSEDPLGWRYFETEYLHFHLSFKNHKRERVTNTFYQIFPNQP